MSKENKVSKKNLSQKKIILPFFVHRPPVETRIPYEKKGHWTQKEKFKYVIFLQYFKSKFTSRDKKKRFCRIFKLMADFIKTRTHNQCRSHHQKMEKQRFQVDNIINAVVSKYHPRIYKQLSERYRVQIQNLEQLESQKQKNDHHFQIESIIPFQTSTDKKQRPNFELQQIKNPMISLQKQAEISLPSFLLQNAHQNYIPFEAAFKNHKQPRVTKAQESQSQDSNNHHQLQNFKFPIQNQYFTQKQQSLDFNSINGFSNKIYKEPNQYAINALQYLQTLDLKKLQCYNRATYHYNQMQLELNNMSECEKEKQIFLFGQKQEIKEQKKFPFEFSNFSWGF